MIPLPAAASSRTTSCTSRLARMSRPRVGSSSSSTFGLARHPLAEHDLLLVAARQRRSRARRRGCGSAPCTAARSPSRPRAGTRSSDGSAMLRSTSMLRISPCEPRSSGTSAKPASIASRGVRIDERLAPDLSPRARTGARRTARAARWCAPRRPGPPGPGSRPRAGRTTRARAPTAAPPARSSAAPPRSTLVVPARSSTSLSQRRLPRRQLGDPLAVAQADDPVGDLQDLAQAVRDVDHRDAVACADRAAASNSRAASVSRQRRGRLVEQQHLGVQRQRARDLHALLLPRRQRPQRRVRIDVAAHPLQHLRGPAVERRRDR